MSGIATPANLEGEASWSQEEETTFNQLFQPDEGHLEKTAEEASALFSSTISSLAHDVRALGHLTTWKHILEEEDNGGNPAEEENQREALLESLCDLDDVVSSVEKKVGVLRQIVSEELRALDNLDLLYKDSMEQNENLEYLVERCLQIKEETSIKDKITTNINNTQTTNNNQHSEERDAPEYRCNIPSSPASAKNGASGASRNFPSPGKSKGSNFPGPGRSVNNIISNQSYDSGHAQVEGLHVHIDRVTQEELEAIPRTTRGRVQVAVLNDALEHIEKAFRKKAVKERKRMMLLEEAKQVALLHYQNRSPEKIPDDGELLRNLTVNEEELRQWCSFFNAGEIQARQVLMVLKTLRRLKQVPAKGQVLYKLCL